MAESAVSGIQLESHQVILRPLGDREGHARVRAV